MRSAIRRTHLFSGAPATRNLDATYHNYHPTSAPRTESQRESHHRTGVNPFAGRGWWGWAGGVERVVRTLRVSKSDSSPGCATRAETTTTTTTANERGCRGDLERIVDGQPPSALLAGLGDLSGGSHSRRAAALRGLARVGGSRILRHLYAQGIATRRRGQPTFTQLLSLRQPRYYYHEYLIINLESALLQFQKQRQYDHKTVNDTTRLYR